MFRLPRSASIGRRLTAGFALTLGLSLVGSGYGAWSIDRIARKTRELTEESVVRERLVADAFRNVAAGLRRTAAIAVSGDPALADFFAEDIRETTGSTNALFDRLEPMLATDEERRVFVEMRAVRKVYVGARDKISALQKAGEREQSRKVLDETFTPAGRGFTGALQRLTDLQRQQVDAQAAGVALASRQALLVLLVFGSGSLLCGGALAWRLTRSISRPIGQAVEAADRIARLDLTQRIEAHDRDETGRLLQALQSMQTSLRGLVERIRQSTDSIGTASAEIAAGNLDLSTRTEHAASSLQQTATAMLQMSEGVRQSSHNVRSASDLASAATDVAAQGGAVVAKVVTTMQDINASSQKIADIIGVIDGIAFQTNILALNAAVEAARAGPQGRGFAVVAAEVRLLAQRSAGAAKEIKGLIGASVDKVEAGTRLVAGAGSTMTEVVESSRRVSALIQEISESAAHQSDGIGQVNATVTQLDQLTQQNAALVEEAAAAAGSLKGQAAELAGMVQRFVV